MRPLLPFVAFTGAVFARVNIMLPFYVYPTQPDWQATIDTVNAHPNLHFYLVVNPSNGPTNSTPDPYFNYTHGYNTDWTTGVAKLNNLANAQTIGYVSTSYNNGKNNRTREAVIADIDNWSQWKEQQSDNSPNANISIHGIWFDETSVDRENYEFYQNLTAHARQAFNASEAPQYTSVLNTGVAPDPAYERELFDLADVVVTRETCWQYNSTENAAECPMPYVHYDVATLKNSSGLPNHTDLYPKASVIVHYVRPEPAVDATILADQIKRTVELGIHSLYFTSAKLWNMTTIGPATVGAVADAVDAAQP
ncbi:Spherulation-specific family 4-domain-containing protein [Truncatella angustata]|uniref:Spherulation-specific family 4-domain-containing protein n=1 Tax=Truncatella angustata TaxID=152316 RepID=A0A9P8UMR9_9PEZI|nr:Spherulation-specific family 4-domain-containing protein [Truncatella angustata]KAH6655068.1 Spherulation-specific family 4-domain-containing protein [Truncatella angustata]KAH8195413.1 hypothetical protein TruAng_010420 [Truncatella angustata]